MVQLNVLAVGAVNYRGRNTPELNRHHAKVAEKGRSDGCRVAEIPARIPLPELGLPSGGQPATGSRPTNESGVQDRRAEKELAAWKRCMQVALLLLGWTAANVTRQSEGPLGGLMLGGGAQRARVSLGVSLCPALCPWL